MTRLVQSFIGWFIFRTGLFRLFLGDRAVIALFHRVDDRLKGNPIACTSVEFETYCKFFKEYFAVIPLAELIRRLEAGERMKRCLAITFDDGYHDNYEIAAPALRAKELPACFFIATGFIGSETRPWWDEEYGVESKWMSWDEVRDLKEQGFEIGIHTANHVDLSRVDSAVARKEIVGAEEELSERGVPSRLFSYPYGRRHQITEESRDIVRAAGLRCCLSAYGGVVRPGDNPFHLRRMPVSPWYLSPFHFGFDVLFRS